MPITTTIDVERNLIIRKVTGKFVIDDLKAAYAYTFDHPDYTPSMPALWDLLDADIADVSSEVLREVVKLVQTVSEDRGSGYKVAFVAPDDISYGITSMFKAYGDNLSFRMSIFRNMDEATSWLET
jgi:hypothetical protein